MNAEKIFKREDGSQVKIVAGFSVSFFDNKPSWTISVNVREKGKKNWLGVFFENGYEYRNKALDEREKFILDAQLKHCTLEEMYEVKMIFWYTLKPEL